jgi:signal transduction histidine kinase
MSAGFAVGPTSPARPQPPHPVAVGESDRAIRDVLPAVVRQVPLGIAVVRPDRSIAYLNDEFARVLRLPVTPTGSGYVLDPMLRGDGTPFEPGDEPLDVVVGSGQPITRRAVMLQRRDGGASAATITMTPLIRRSGDVVGAVLYVEATGEEDDDPALQDAFVAVLSHELRTPITSIYGGTQLLLKDRMPPAVRSTVIHDIASEAERLHGLVEDLLAITRIDRGLIQGDREPVLLQRLIAAAVAAEQRRWPGHRIEVQTDLDLPAVCADDGFTMQVLRNLISNSAKYGPVDQAVLVTARAVGDRVAVEVLDRGPGFPDGTGPDAFRLFYRSPTVAARVAGTGIGLYVARALVEAQGGRIWLRRREGGGAEVGFDLPIYQADDPD